MKNRLLALLLVLMFSVTVVSILPVTTNITEPTTRLMPEVKNTLADG